MHIRSMAIPLSLLLGVLLALSGCDDDSGDSAANDDVNDEISDDVNEPGTDDPGSGQPDAGQPDADEPDTDEPADDGSDVPNLTNFTSDTPLDLKSTAVHNEVVYVSPQCYTITEDEAGRVNNTCYTCHMESVAPNFTMDYDFQQEYAFTLAGTTNPWLNLFEDRSERIAAQSDTAILEYIHENNYHDEQGKPWLQQLADSVPAGWDGDGNGQWDGYVPDVYFNFDEAGFDRDLDGNYTGWRVYAYYPFPTTYWPTNGHTGDALIRLPETFQQFNGEFDLETYKLNLALVESLIKKRDIVIDPVDENRYQVDLNKDGVFGTANQITYAWNRLQGETMTYVGDAKAALEAGDVHLAAGLFPEGTEFVQSLRYVDVTDDGGIGLSARMKEFRYGVKEVWRTYAYLRDAAADEAEDAEMNPDETDVYVGSVERGVNNGDTGWRYQAFIEDRQGVLRPQTVEETAFCMGCHGGLGVTADSNFSFARKVETDDPQRGWYHWSQQGMEGLNEPKGQVKGAGVYYEYAYYLMYNHTLSEFRDNPESEAKFFDSEGHIDYDLLAGLREDITVALYPSRERALALNKAYRTIVEDQDYVLGRDPNLNSYAETVYDEVVQDDPTGVVDTSSIQKVAGCFEQGVACESQDLLDEESARAAQVLGNGMGGPSNTRYEVDFEGEIHKSQYSIDVDGLTFTFPDRLTLPTRAIVPLAGIESCYECHRLQAPVVDGDDKAATKESITRVDMGATEASAAEAAVLTQLTDDPARDTGAKWSPDGSKIAFVSDRSGSSQIWVINPDGSGLQQVTQGPAKHAWPEWNTASTRIIYWGHNADTGEHLIQHNNVAGDDEVTVIASTDYLNRPQWHPDGDIIAYSRRMDGIWNVWVAEAYADGNGERDFWQVTTHEWMDSNPLWSPDGETLAYKVAPTTGDYALTYENFITFENGYDNPTIHEWDGPEASQMYDWSPDGEQISYTAEIITSAGGADQVSYANLVSAMTIGGGTATAETAVNISKGQTLGDRGAVFSPADGGNEVAFWAWDKNYLATLWLYDQAADEVTQLTTSGFDFYPEWRPDGEQLVFESMRSGNMDLWLIDLD